MNNFPMVGSHVLSLEMRKMSQTRQQAKMFETFIVSFSVCEFFFLSPLFLSPYHCVLEKSHTFSTMVLIFAIEFLLRIPVFSSSSNDDEIKSMKRHANKVIAISTESQIIFRTDICSRHFIWTKLLTQFPKMLPNNFIWILYAMKHTANFTYLYL